MLLLMSRCPLAPPSNGSIHPLQRLLLSRNLEPFLVLLPAVRTRAHIANANIPQLKMNQPFHAVDIRSCNALPSPRRRIRRRMPIRIIPKQSEVVRALLRPLINPPMHIVRTTDFQPHAPRRLARGIRHQRVILLRGADRIPDTADIRQTPLGKKRRPNIRRRRRGPRRVDRRHPEHVDVAGLVRVGDGLVQLREQVRGGFGGQRRGDPGEVTGSRTQTRRRFRRGGRRCRSRLDGSCGRS